MLPTPSLHPDIWSPAHSGSSTGSDPTRLYSPDLQSTVALFLGFFFKPHENATEISASHGWSGSKPPWAGRQRRRTRNPAPRLPGEATSQHSSSPALAGWIRLGEGTAPVPLCPKSPPSRPPVCASLQPSLSSQMFFFSEDTAGRGRLALPITHCGTYQGLAPLPV